jgi:hypothetical protein
MLCAFKLSNAIFIGEPEEILRKKGTVKKKIGAED